MPLKNDKIDGDASSATTSGLAIKHLVPEPSAAASQAARWMKEPHLLLVYLTDVLNQLLERCEEYSGDDAELQYRLKRDDRGPRHAWLMFVNMWLQAETDAIDLVNRSGNIPFALATVEALYGSLKVSEKAVDWSEFTNSVMTFKQELQRLADWIQFQRELADPSKSVADSGGTERKTLKEVQDFTTSLGLILCESKRTLRRNGAKYSHLKPVRLSTALWELLELLLIGTTTGLTRKHLSKALRTSASAVSTRKCELKNLLSAFDLTIPGDEFRIEARC